MVPTIAGEKVVAGGAGKEHFHPLATGMAADGLRGEGGDVGRRFVEHPDERVDIFDRPGVEISHLQRSPKVRAHPLGKREIFREAFGGKPFQFRRADGVARVPFRIPKRLHGIMRDGGGIESAGQESAQRDIGDELTTDSLTEVVATRFDGVLLLERLDLLRVVRGDETGGTDLAVGAPFGIGAR